MIKRVTVSGIGVSPGIAIGEVLVLRENEMCAFRLHLAEDRIENEIKRLDRAVKSSKEQLKKIRNKAALSLGEDHAYLFDAQLLLLDDEMLIGKTLQVIKKEKVNSEWALEHTLKEIRQLFSSLEDSFFAERIGDVDDVGKRLLLNLSGNSPQDLSILQSDTIIVAHKLTPSEAVLINKEKVVGFVTDVGGKTSHTAILAKSFGIPAVIGLHDFSSFPEDGSSMVLDGSSGEVILYPNAQDLSEYRQRKSSFEVVEKELLKQRELPAVTLDGHKIKLLANIEFPYEISLANEYGAEGIGLYRSEFLFVKVAPRLPSEEDHFKAYTKTIALSSNSEITIRTLDLGGEKFFHQMLDETHSSNPILGLRAVRYCFRNVNIFETQLRAILRSSVYGKIKLLIPMITNVEEILKVKELLEKVKEELRKEGTSFDENIPLGIMIEVPSAAVSADLFASEVDFFSVGTNDLIQYLLAIERGNEDVAYLYDPLHPAVLRTLKFVADCAKNSNIELSLCGEMASDPLYATVLMGLGYSEFSMNAASIPHVKNLINNISLSDAKSFTEEVMKMKKGRDIQSFASSQFKELLGR